MLEQYHKDFKKAFDDINEGLPIFKIVFNNLGKTALKLCKEYKLYRSLKTYQPFNLILNAPEPFNQIPENEEFDLEKFILFIAAYCMRFKDFQKFSSKSKKLMDYSEHLTLYKSHYFENLSTDATYPYTSLTPKLDYLYSGYHHIDDFYLSFF